MLCKALQYWQLAVLTQPWPAQLYQLKHQSQLAVSCRGVSAFAILSLQVMSLVPGSPGIGIQNLSWRSAEWCSPRLDVVSSCLPRFRLPRPGRSVMLGAFERLPSQLSLAKRGRSWPSRARAFSLVGLRFSPSRMISGITSPVPAPETWKRFSESLLSVLREEPRFVSGPGLEVQRYSQRRR